MGGDPASLDAPFADGLRAANAAGLEAMQCIALADRLNAAGRPADVVSRDQAWRARNTGDGLTRSHAANQISIFWRSVVYVGIGLVLTYFLFGVLVIMAAIIWYILRVLRGLKALSAGQPPEHPQSWLF